MTDAALLRAGVAAGALVLGTFLMVTQAMAAPGGSAPTRPSAAPARLELFDDDEDSGMFDLAEMSPGRAASNCIAVSSGGPGGDTDVRLSGISTGTGLDWDLDMTVEEGIGGTFNDCTGFRGRELYRGSLAAFTSAHRDFRSGLAAFSPLDVSETKTFRFSIVLHDDPAAQGRSARATFTWEAEGPGAAASPGVPRTPQLPFTPSAGGSFTGRPAGSALDRLGAVAVLTVRKVAFPFLLLLVVVAFLMIQDRIDRRDPKLALAPVYPEPDVGFDDPTSTNTGRT
jgi:hypothetical protein